MFVSDDALFDSVIKQYPGCCLDYCILQSDAPDAGEASHREAVRLAMEQFVNTLSDGEWHYDITGATARRIDAQDWLRLPEQPWRRNVTKNGKPVVTFIDCPKRETLPYWYAFLEPPHGSHCLPEDFLAVNTALFPNGTDALTVYEWSTDWSEYFDDGHEWWGAACWSIYDQKTDRYIVIMTSATD